MTWKFRYFAKHKSSVFDVAVYNLVATWGMVYVPMPDLKRYEVDSRMVKCRRSHLVVYDLPFPIPLLQRREELHDVAVIQIELVSSSVEAYHDCTMLEMRVTRRRDDRAAILGVE